MAVVLRSLRDFKEFLRTPGARIQIVHNTLVDRQPLPLREAYRKKGLYELRTVHALSKIAAVFEVPGHNSKFWLYWDRGTRKWRLSADAVAVPLNTALGAPDEVVYRCSIDALKAGASAPMEEALL